jgi:osmoprotectant transport system permease protein
VAGLAVNDNALMLAGALPAALLAVGVQLAFDALERRVTPARKHNPAENTADNPGDTRA